VIPRIRFTHEIRKVVDLGAPRGSQVKYYDMNFFLPETNTIEVNPKIIFLCDNGLRNFISCFFHELVHWYQWWFVYKRNTEWWNREEDKQEKQANEVQDFVYRILLRCK
jgi:hypothetical protein